MTDTYQEEALYAMALTRLAGLNSAAALHLYRELGSAVNVMHIATTSPMWCPIVHRVWWRY